jgi:hypothetical protein
MTFDATGLQHQHVPFQEGPTASSLMMNRLFIEAVGVGINKSGKPCTTPKNNSDVLVVAGIEAILSNLRSEIFSTCLVLPCRFDLSVCVTWSGQKKKQRLENKKKLEMLISSTSTAFKCLYGLYRLL